MPELRITISSPDGTESLTVPTEMSKSRLPPVARSIVPSRRGIVENLIGAAVIALAVWAWGRYSDAPGLWVRAILVAGAVAAMWLLALMADALRRIARDDPGGRAERAVAELPGTDAFRAAVTASVTASLPELVAPDIGKELERVIEEAAEAGKFRPRPSIAAPRDRFERDGFAVSATSWPEHIDWSDLREGFRQPGLRGLVAYGAGLGGGRPVWVGLSIELVEQGFHRGLVLELSGARARAVSIEGITQSFVPPVPGRLELMDEGKAPTAQRIMVNDLKTGEVWAASLLCEGEVYGGEPPNFGWVLTGNNISIAGSLKDILRSG